MEELVTKNEDEKNITTCNFLPFDVSKIHWNNHIYYSFITGETLSHYLQTKLDEKSTRNEKKVKEKRKILQKN